MLHGAARGGHEAVVQLLLERGADVTVKDIHGWTALHEVATSRSEAAARVLLENGADIAAETDCRETAPHIAASKGHERLVQLLLEKGSGGRQREPGGVDGAAWSGQEQPRDGGAAGARRMAHT